MKGYLKIRASWPVLWRLLEIYIERETRYYCKGDLAEAGYWRAKHHIVRQFVRSLS